ncbi:NAD(P)-dependent oxidoreductase [Candidatus Woesearchaeota archaeon]|jgi:dTDP-glucose 4,6-dehydratase|nr:NAD(P)-dependent oxidoreductase [Candidatus Woesearchaeota archaeon]MBT6672552.1 NAD(P)-dependent oxidoreductase [Lentimicrobiaceae bacterium]
MKSVDWNINQDLEEILNGARKAFKSLDGANIFLTGGTGFIGKWLLDSVFYANNKLNLNITVTVLTRNSKAFLSNFPHFKSYPSVSYITGDIRDLKDVDGEYTHLVHAATDASAYLNENDPKKMFDTIIQGTQCALDFAKEKSIKHTLFLSSGAIYGQQPWEMERVNEDWFGSLDCLNPKNTYSEAKRAAEMLCSIYGKQFGLNISVARIFSLLGPYLPLDSHFAAGNFINNAINSKPIVVNGNGLPCRSYLYVADLTVWLWNMLAFAKSGKVYNVGSDESISISELAERVSNVLGDGDYQILSREEKGWNPGRYVPDTTLITSELGVKRMVSLDEAIIKTAIWNGWKN